MSLLNEDLIKTLGDVFTQRPSVPDDKLPPSLCATQEQCVFCKKFIPIHSINVINTGLVKAHEPLCPSCMSTFKDQARIVCIPCKIVVLWVDPHKEKTGFEFKRRHVYHVAECPTCKPGIEKTRILEKVVFFNENNIPYE